MRRVGHGETCTSLTLPSPYDASRCSTVLFEHWNLSTSTQRLWVARARALKEGRWGAMFDEHRNTMVLESCVDCIDCATL